MAAEHRTRAWSRRRTLAQGGALITWLAMAGRNADAAASLDRLDFDATSLADALAALGGTPVGDTAIMLTLPSQVDNGAMVPVSVGSALPGTTEIAILVEANPNPLVARFDIPPGTEAWVSTRIKMAESCRVFGVVRAGGRLYQTSARADVAIGGCG